MSETTTAQANVTAAVIAALAEQTDDELRLYSSAYARWALTSEGEERDIHLARLKYHVIATSYPIQGDDPIGRLWASFTRHQVKGADWAAVAEALLAAEQEVER